MALIMAFATITGISSAQTSRPGFGTSQPSELPASLEGIDGITPGMNVDQLVDAGSAAVTAGRLENGRRILLAAVARSGRNLRALSQLAFAYERSAERVRGDGTNPQAVAQGDRFIDQAVDVYLTAGSVAIEQDQLDVAEQCYNRILIHHPGNVKALLGLARIYAATERRLQAIDRYKDYIASPEGKNDPKGYLELGELYLDGTYWRLALDQLKKAQNLNPNDPDVDMALARTYQKGDSMDEAMSAAQQAVKKAPDRGKYRDFLAELYLARGDAEQASIEALRAIEATRKGLQVVPDNTELLKELSCYYVTYEKALQSLLTEGKANPIVRVDLARAIQEHTVVDRTLALQRALRVLSEVPGEGRDDIRLLEEMAHVQQELGLTQQARETCRRLLQVDPGNSVATGILKATEATGGQ
jgi:tetratricopeptide (TPR) repeat protein